jgi:mannose-6-phosphate isomerase-like protein (cupin superfamily)
MVVKGEVMRAEILRADEDKEFNTSELCAILEIANDSGDVVSISRARVSKGVTTKWHHLVSTEERYIIVSGRGRVEVSDNPSADVGAYDVVRIPANTRQRIANTGESDFVFFCVCPPPFRSECYVPLEE